MSLTGIVGAGASNGSTVLEAGGQFSYFLDGDFSNGSRLGFETMYASISPSLIHSPFTIKSGLSIGFFFGYKNAIPIGLTLAVQIGLAGVMDIDRENNSSSFKFVGGRVIFHLNAGWSF